VFSIEQWGNGSLSFVSLQEMTQAELARALGVSQQTVFSYELGDRQVSVFILRELAAALKVSLDELIGTKDGPAARKRRISPRVARWAERIQGLSSTNKRMVIRIIDTLILAGSISPSPRRELTRSVAPTKATAQSAGRGTAQAQRAGKECGPEGAASEKTRDQR
jgi:transcriptional regulator with XRE-family HTH domain